MRANSEIDRRGAAFVAVAAVLGFMCGPSSSPAAAADDDPMATAKRISQQWVDAYNSRDAAALEALYSRDAMLLPRDHAQAVIGEIEIRRYFDDLMKRLPAPDYKITRTELIVLSPKAIVQGGTWSSDTLHTSGTYLAVMGNESGEWKIIASTWNAALEPGLASDASNASPPAQSGTSAPGK